MSHCAELFIRGNNRNCIVTQYFCRLFRVSRLSVILTSRFSRSTTGIDDSIQPQSSVEVVTQNHNSESLRLPTKKNKLSQKKSKSVENVVSYLQTRTELSDIQSIPQKYLRRFSQPPEGLYIASSITASKIAEHVTSKNVSDVPFFEVNPGIGLLTRVLLEKGVTNIHVFQSSFWSAMSKLVEECPERIHMHEVDFFSLWKRMLVDNAEIQGGIQNILSVIKPKLWKDVPSMKILVAVPKKNFMNLMTAALIFQKGFFLRGRPEFYLIMTPYDYHCYTCVKSEGYLLYRASSALFQILFDISLLCKLKLKDLIPWTHERATKRKLNLPSSIENDAENVYLVKVTPRAEVHDIIGGVDNLRPLWHFVRQSFKSSNSRVIPFLESWIPGCGPRLIFQGMTIYTKFGDLPPVDVLNLFRQFSQWPEYEECSFLASMETSLLKSYIDSNQESINEADFDSAIEPSHLQTTSNSDN